MQIVIIESQYHKKWRFKWKKDDNLHGPPEIARGEIMRRIQRIFRNTMLCRVRAEWYRREVWKQPRGFSRHDNNTKDAVRTYRRVAYMPTWQAKNGNYFKNVLLGRRLNLIAKRRCASPVLPSCALLASRAIHIFLSPVNSRFCRLIGFNCFDSANHKRESILLNDFNVLICVYIYRYISFL